jgi:GT2 family glycosyltransferase
MGYNELLGKVLLKLYEILILNSRRVPLKFFLEYFEARDLPQEWVSATKDLHIYIPYRDKSELTIQCLKSLFEQHLSAIRIHIHLIDNGSNNSTKDALNVVLNKDLPPGFAVTQHSSDLPFNFSKLCNVALSAPSESKADTYLLFLNNDIVLEDQKSLIRMVAFMEKNLDAGALGITLLYPDRKIQHIFAAPGVKIVAAHPFKGLETSRLTEWNRFARKVPAVTGACLMVSARAFHRVGGFDENLPTVGQDIDLCLKLREAGFSNWVLPNIVALHFESASRKRARIALHEVEYIHRKWGRKLTQNEDYPIKVSRWSEQPALRLFDREYPYHLALSSTQERRN